MPHLVGLGELLPLLFCRLACEGKDLAGYPVVSADGQRGIEVRYRRGRGELDRTAHGPGPRVVGHVEIDRQIFRTARPVRVRDALGVEPPFRGHEVVEFLAAADTDGLLLNRYLRT